MIRFIAHGGMGEVYEAEDQKLQERVTQLSASSHQLAGVCALALDYRFRGVRS